MGFKSSLWYTTPSHQVSLDTMSRTSPESSPHPNGLSRREFLRLVWGAASGLGVAALGLPGAPAQAQEITPLPEVEHPPVAIPPSLMLHSRDARPIFTQTLIEQLRAAGYRPTTYLEWERALKAGEPVERPTVISIDDITMAQGNGTFRTFRTMYEWYRDAGVPAVFGVITKPDQPQDEERWDEVAEWVRNGFELATHTSYHPTFNAPDTGPRRDFSARDYEREIVDSARFIEEKLQARGIENYQVRTLITPYGSGYSYHRPVREVHEGIRLASTQTNIKFVVGIVEGRGHLNSSLLQDDNQELIYLGRTPPAYDKNEEGRDVPNGHRTFRYLDRW